jgi:hypothetical protein
MMRRARREASDPSANEPASTRFDWGKMAITKYEQQRIEKANATKFVESPDRGHALTIDGGWREVANTALGFVKRFV